MDIGEYCKTKQEYHEAIRKYSILVPRMSMDLNDSEDKLRELSYKLNNLLMEIYKKSL